MQGISNCIVVLLVLTSAIQVVWEMVQEYQKKGIFVCFVKLRPQLKRMFIKSNIIGALGGNRVFMSLSDALCYLEDNIVRSNV